MFKHGCGITAEEFGAELCDFVWPMGICQPSHQVVVVPSPYQHVLPAAGYLARAFQEHLNIRLSDAGQSVSEDARIYRNTTYREDYSSMTREDRLKLISGDKFYIDGSFVEGKHCLFIDDIRVTGSHEWVISEMCRNLRLDIRATFIYYAEIADVGIPASIEADLNRATITGVCDLADLMNSPRFVFNTRVIKMVLAADSHDLDQFTTLLSRSILSKLYRLAVGNDYHRISGYTRNFDRIRSLVTSPKQG
ncbi:MAG: PRTase ComF-like [Verrucomicrobia bacterium]|nr:MAG: PRTase ComF-like [Verrucomicrobiota bacterium]